MVFLIFGPVWARQTLNTCDPRPCSSSSFRSTASQSWRGFSSARSTSVPMDPRCSTYGAGLYMFFAFIFYICFCMGCNDIFLTPRGHAPIVLTFIKIHEIRVNELKST